MEMHLFELIFLSNIYFTYIICLHVLSWNIAICKGSFIKYVDFLKTPKNLVSINFERISKYVHMNDTTLNPSCGEVEWARTEECLRDYSGEFQSSLLHIMHII